MFIMGNADEARSLARGIVVKTKTIYELTKDIDQNVRTLGNSFQDDGFKEYEEVVRKIYKSINTHLEDVKSLQSAINAYAEVLETK